MSNEYYGIATSPNEVFLLHYGIHGMKWGVRKTAKSGNPKHALRAYNRAIKKLAKLEAKTDIGLQKQLVKKHNKRAALALGVGALGAGTIAGNYLYAKNAAKGFTPVLAASNAGKSPRKKIILGEGKGIKKVGEGLGTGPAGSASSNPASIINGGSNRVNPHKTIERIGSALTAAGLGTAAYQKGRALAAKYRTTERGHAKAIAKRDAWKRKMHEAFKGTRYSGEYQIPQKYKRRR